MNAFAFRFKSDPADVSPEKLLLRQFLGLFAPVLDLVGAERHVLGDPHCGQKVAMADLAARILAAALLESDDRAVLALLDDFGGDQSAIDERRAERDILALAMRENVADLDDIADIGFDFFDLQEI